jgi:putative peptidoglycan lipid II flippase
LIRLIFERRAFDEESTRATAWALLFYALGLVAHAVVEIVARVFYALHDTRTPVAIGVLAMAANIALSLALMPLFTSLGWMPHGGLALANSLATTGEMAILLYLVNKRMRGLEGRRLWGAVWRMGVGCLALLAGLALTSRALAASPAWLISGAGILVGGALYALVTLLLGSDEPVALVDSLRRRLRI